MKSQQSSHTRTHKQWAPLCGDQRETPFISLRPCSSFLCLASLCAPLFWIELFLLTHTASSSPLFLPFATLIPPLSSLALPNSSRLPSADIVMLLHTTLSRLKRWSHEWSLQFKSTQPSRRLKWIFCIYSCNNDSIWGYYLQTVAEFSAALITEWRAGITKMKNVFILTCLEWTGAIN